MTIDELPQKLLTEVIEYDHCAMAITVYDEDNDVEYRLAARCQLPRTKVRGLKE